MWEWKREQKWKKMINTWTEKELRQKAEVEAWRRERGMSPITLTRDNVGREYLKMWDWKREQKYAAVMSTWTERELRYKKEIEAWWKEADQPKIKLTRYTVTGEYHRMLEWKHRREIEAWWAATGVKGKKLTVVNVVTEYKKMLAYKSKR